MPFCYTCNIALFRQCTVSNDSQGVYQNEPIAEIVNDKNALNAQCSTVVEPCPSWFMEEELQSIAGICTLIATLNREQTRYEMKLAKSETSEEQDKIRRLIEAVQSDLKRSQAFLKHSFKSVAFLKVRGRNDKEKIELLADDNADLQCAQVERDRLSRLLESELSETKNKLIETRSLLASSHMDEQSLAVMCSICLAARISMAFQCGHLSCGDCSSRLTQCHVCRQLILRQTRIFL